MAGMRHKKQKPIFIHFEVSGDNRVVAPDILCELLAKALRNEVVTPGVTTFAVEDGVVYRLDSDGYSVEVVHQKRKKDRGEKVAL